MTTATAPMRLLAAALLLLGIAGAAGAAPETGAPAGVSATSANAVVVEADQGIEWQRDARLVIARGNATAVRGDTKVSASVLRAHYRETADGSTDIFQLDAEGNVRITTPTQTAYGEKAVYDLDKNRIVLSGGKQVGLTTKSSRITADRELEYDTRERTLVARGNAVAHEKDRTIYGEVITAYLRESGQGGDLAVSRLTAEQRVRVVTPEEEYRADRGTYDLETGVATLTGAVKITRGDNVLNGCRGELNTRTGVSRLFACEGAGGSGRVRGVIIPEQLKRE